MTPEMVNAALGVGAIFVGFIIWLSRLESLVKFREKDCAQNTEAIKDRMRENKAEIDKQIAELKQYYAEKMDEVGREMKEMSKTMNQILQSVSKIQGNIEGSSKHDNNS